MVLTAAGCGLAAWYSPLRSARGGVARSTAKEAVSTVRQVPCKGSGLGEGTFVGPFGAS